MSRKNAKRVRRMLKTIQQATGTKMPTEYIDHLVRTVMRPSGNVDALGNAIMIPVPVYQRTLKPGCDRHFLQQQKKVGRS